MTVTRTRRTAAGHDRPTLLTVGELAEMFRASTDTIYSWAAEGRLPKPTRIGRRLLWRAEAIEDLLQ
jgi:excisionase family DNA binding protein